MGQAYAWLCPPKSTALDTGLSQPSRDAVGPALRPVAARLAFYGFDGPSRLASRMSRALGVKEASRTGWTAPRITKLVSILTSIAPHRTSSLVSRDWVESEPIIRYANGLKGRSWRRATIYPNCSAWRSGQSCQGARPGYDLRSQVDHSFQTRPRALPIFV